MIAWFRRWAKQRVIRALEVMETDPRWWYVSDLIEAGCGRNTIYATVGTMVELGVVDHRKEEVPMYSGSATRTMYRLNAKGRAYLAGTRLLSS